MKNLNINCPVGGTGYGITSFNIVKELHSLNVNISLFPIGNQFHVNSEDEKFLVQELISNNSKFDYDAPCLKIWHQHELASRIGKKDYYVFPFFEVDKLHDIEIHNINSSDFVFTASQWGKSVLENNRISKPIIVAPLGVDAKIFTPPNNIKIENPNYIFFHIGKWEVRKSHDFLIKCFNEAFDEKDNVELWMVPHNPFITKEEEQSWLNLIIGSKLKNKIKIYNRLPTQYHLAEFINNGDCGVFLSRAEGWNNEIPEAMAMNKPIIATNYSAHTEYCNSDNSFLVNINDTEPAIDGKWFSGHGNWAKLDKEQLEQTVEYMRFVYRNNIKTNPSGLDTASKYSWKNTATIIDQTLTENNSYNANTKKKTRRKTTKVSK